LGNQAVAVQVERRVLFLGLHDLYKTAMQTALVRKTVRRLFPREIT